MTSSFVKIEVYLESGKKLTFAGATEWPGWCRSGKDEGAALQALVTYGPRYAEVLIPDGIDFQIPTRVDELNVVERLAGNGTTEFGAPDIAPTGDSRPIDEVELRRLQSLLVACWRKFDRAVASAGGKPLRKGPRGGGREVEEIARHVAGAEEAYLSRLGRKFEPGEAADPNLARQALLTALAAAAHGQTPARGPRGGKIWSPRYFVRRAAWHILDHAWEIEDRMLVV